MCGIFGLVSDDISDDLTRAVFAQLRHRGPDASGEKKISGKIYLAHLRLAINDLSIAGAQPMEDAPTGNVIVLNGEVYNFHEIRKELKAVGYVFHGKSDTEVLLKGYGHWGRGVLSRLVGMFAFAVWDAREQSLFLARDRMGEKPLYYVELPRGQFAFSSELKTLLLHPELSRKINKDALAEYFANGYVSTRNAIFKGIKKLPPAHWMVVREGRVSESCEYWNLAGYFLDKRTYRSFEEACDVGAETFNRAAKSQLVSDVPLGAFLSGGVDSGLVAAAMRQAGGDIRTFSAGFDEPEFDERADALAISERLGTTHTAFSMGHPSFNDILAPYRACDEPFADTSAVPTYYLAQMTRSYVTVCLSGDGGDELFGGYPTYLADKLYWATRHLPRSVMGLGGRLASFVPSRHGKIGLDYKLMAFFNAARKGHYESAHQCWRQLFAPEEAQALLTEDWSAMIRGRDPNANATAYWDELPASHYLDRAMFVDMKTWLVDDILFKVDRMTMAHSLESRTPFLDHRVVEFAASLPVEYKIRGFETKRILKEMAASKYRLDYRGKKKRGFNAPASHWIVLYAKEIMDYLMASGFFKEVPLTRLFDDHVTRKRDNNFKIMCLIGLVAWSEGLSL